jgi:hypothetical protein
MAMARTRPIEVEEVGAAGVEDTHDVPFEVSTLPVVPGATT